MMYLPSGSRERLTGVLIQCERQDQYSDGECEHA